MSKELPEIEEQIDAKEGSEETEVDIVGGDYLHANNTAVTEDPYATECSSSFADTDSDSEKISEPSEAEVDTQFFGDSDLPFTDVFDDVIHERKKKLTNHWRGFIRPLMWRCKWTELKIKEIESLIAKHSTKLAANDELKQRGLFEQSTEGGCSRMMPLNELLNAEKLVKRRKRKKAEDWFDTAANNSECVIYSYLENQKCNQEGSVLDDFARTAVRKRMDEEEMFGVESNQDLLQFKSGDSFEEVLENIDILQLRVHKLKQQINMLLPKDYPFSSSEDMDSNSRSSSCSQEDAQSLETTKTSVRLGEYDFGNLELPECYGDAVDVPDITESTVAQLPTTDFTFHEPQIVHYSEDVSFWSNVCGNEVEIVEPQMLDNILMTTSGDAELPPSNRCEPTEEDESNPRPDTKDEEPSLQASLLSAGNKRKRGERKIASTGWGKKAHDDSDNH